MMSNMLSVESIKSILQLLYNQYDDIKIRIAGSYANNTEIGDSHLDIVIDGVCKR